MDINQKFQLPQFHFDSQGGFLAKIYIWNYYNEADKNIFDQNLSFTSIYFNWDLQYHSGFK